MAWLLPRLSFSSRFSGLPIGSWISVKLMSCGGQYERYSERESA